METGLTLMEIPIVNEDVYDQNDVDYYWHGEGADVYYMPVE